MTLNSSWLLVESWRDGDPRNHPRLGIRFGRPRASALKRRRPWPGDKWFMGKMFIRIRDKLYYIWWPVDLGGNGLDTRRAT
jgi:transposase-like protein